MNPKLDLYFTKFKEACRRPSGNHSLLQYEDTSWLNCSLDNLLSLNLKVGQLIAPESVQKITFILRQCFTLVPPHETLLVAKCCQLTLFLVRKQAVLEKPVLDIALPWFSKAIADSGDLALLDILQALEAVLSHSTNYIKESQVGDEVLSSLSTELETRASLTPLDVKVWRVQCLKALAPVFNSPASRKSRFMEILSKLLQHAPQRECEADAQVVKLVLESVEIMCQGDPEASWLTDNLGDILGILITFLHFGLQGWQYQTPSRLFPLPGAQWEPSNAPSLRSQTAKRRQKKRVSNISSGPEMSDHEDSVVTPSVTLKPGYMSAPSGLTWLTSDSEVSDSEGGRTRRLRTTQARVRLAAVNLVVTIAKTVNVRDLFGYYSSLLGSQGLGFVLINDVNPRLREVSATSLAYLLGNAKSYLAQAQHSLVTSYTPFSSVLASFLDSMHQCVIRALQNSASMFVLHLASSLVDVSPYHRLRPDLLPPLLAVVLPLIKYKAPYGVAWHERPSGRTGSEVVVSVAAVTVLGCVVAVEPHSEHLTSLLSSSSPPVPLPGLQIDTGQSWVLSSSLQYLQGDNQKAAHIPLRVEWWQVLANLLRHHFPLVREHVNLITTAILRDTVQSNLSEHVKFHALRTLQHMATSLGTSEADQLKCLQVWTKVLESQVLALAGESPTLTIAVCGCLSAMSPAAYQHLSEKLQICCVTALLYCSRDDEASVRAEALQALAAYLAFPAFSQDEQFLCDCSEIICRLVKDPIPLVSSKAAWALGNLTDMLYKNQYEEEIIPPTELINICLETAQGTIKVRANGVRSLGNVLGLLKEKHLKRPEYKDVPMKAAHVLVNTSSTSKMMKVCWNACYALGSMLKNEALHETSSSWQEMVLQALCNLVVRSSNFKVRTNACIALSCIAARKNYGTQYLAVWRAVLGGLDNAQNTTDFREVKHQDGLLEQLCLTLCHLVAVVEVGDLSSLHEVIVYHLDTMQHHMSRFLKSTVPERTEAVLKAASSIAQLREGTELTTMQNNALTILSGICTFDV